jgi:hypothetical protein
LGEEGAAISAGPLPYPVAHMLVTAGDADLAATSDEMPTRLATMIEARPADASDVPGDEPTPNSQAAC